VPSVNGIGGAVTIAGAGTASAFGLANFQLDCRPLLGVSAAFWYFSSVDTLPCDVQIERALFFSRYESTGVLSRVNVFERQSRCSVPSG
jgi:hypothetical protein